MTSRIAHILIVSLIAACGGGAKKQPVVAPVPDDEPVADKEPEAAPEPPPPPPPKVWHAKAALTPVKGSKMKPTLVSFSRQEDADAATVAADTFDGAKPGTYWLVVREAEECGPNGTKAGGVWGPAAQAAMKVVIAKDLTGGLEADSASVELDGDDSIVGHVLVLHEDKKGKPGKILGCGAIEVGDED